MALKRNSKKSRSGEHGFSLLLVGFALTFGCIGPLTDGLILFGFGMLGAGLWLGWVGCRGIFKALDRMIAESRKPKPFDVSKWSAAVEKIWDWSRSPGYRTPPKADVLSAPLFPETPVGEFAALDSPAAVEDTQPVLEERAEEVVETVVPEARPEPPVGGAGISNILVGGKLRPERVQAKKDKRKKSYTPLEKRATKNARNKYVTKGQRISNRRAERRKVNKRAAKL